MTAATVRWDAQHIQALERDSIRDFVRRYRNYLTGRVLDFGAGKPGTCRVPQPYRDLVAGDYVPFDKGDEFPSGQFDAVLCTQVLQYVADPQATLKQFFAALNPGGYLLMSYPTSWAEVESGDLWRFTRSGMEALLLGAGFELLYHDRRASVDLPGFSFPLGYGVIARRPAPSIPASGAAESDGLRSSTAYVDLATGPDETAIFVSPGLRSTLSADDSALYMTSLLRGGRPFLFLRYGDGAIECIFGLGRGQTCDHEPYTQELGAALLEVWDSCVGAPNVYVGNWLSASFGNDRSTEYASEYAQLLGKRDPHFLHFESLLLTRPSQALLEFYRGVKQDTRRKVYLGPAEHAQGARALGCRHVITPMSGLFAQVDRLTGQLAGMDFDVLLWAAGMAGSIPVIRSWQKHPERTYINLGSALDPLYRGRTRSGQLTQHQARQFFHGVF